MTQLQKQASMFAVNKPVQRPLGSNRILLYGREGVGKSTIAAGFPKSAVIDTEGSHREFEIARADARTWPAFLDSVNEAVAGAPGKIDTIIVDSITEAYNLCRKYVLEREGWEKEQDGGGFGAGWAMVRGEFRHPLNALFDLYENHGVGLVFVTHEEIETVETGTGDYSIIKPMLPDNKKEDSIGVLISRVFDGIYRYSTEGMDGTPQHVLTTHKDGVFTAKDRTARMPKRIVVPELDKGTPTERAKQVFTIINNAYEGNN